MSRLGGIVPPIDPYMGLLGGLSLQEARGRQAAQMAASEAMNAGLSNIGAQRLQAAQFRAQLQAAAQERAQRQALAQQQLMMSALSDMAQRQFEGEQGKLERASRLEVAGKRPDPYERAMAAAIQEALDAGAPNEAAAMNAATQKYPWLAAALPGAQPKDTKSNIQDLTDSLLGQIAKTYGTDGWTNEYTDSARRAVREHYQKFSPLLDAERNDGLLQTYRTLGGNPEDLEAPPPVPAAPGRPRQTILRGLLGGIRGGLGGLLGGIRPQAVDLPPGSVRPLPGWPPPYSPWGIGPEGQSATFQQLIRGY